MIVDTHCHAWRRWPYDVSVPDPDSRGSIQSLLWEMDRNGVNHAAVVCARIGGGNGGAGFSNDGNNAYVTDAAARYPQRITAWVDVDCVWRRDHHAPDSTQRLREIVDRTDARGFTHYVGAGNDGWLRSDDGRAFFAEAERRGLVASLAFGSEWYEDLATVARDHPGLPILLHHMGNPSQGQQRQADIDRLLALAVHDNVGVKVSGFNYNSEHRFDYPYPRGQELFRVIHDSFGPSRLYWGSDFPASRDDLTYRQSIEVLRTHATFLDPDDLDAVLGTNAARLLGLPLIQPEISTPTEGRTP